MTATEADGEPGFWILLFDDKHRAARGHPRADLSAEAQKEMLRWIGTMAGPCDQVAVLSYRGRLRLHQDFTRQPSALLQGIAQTQVRKPKTGARVSAAEVTLQEAFAPAALQARASVYKALEELAQATGRLPGPATVVFVSPGFDENNHFNDEERLSKQGRVYQRLRHAIADFVAAGTVVHVINPWATLYRGGADLLSRHTGGWYATGFEAPTEGSIYELH